LKNKLSKKESVKLKLLSKSKTTESITIDLSSAIIDKIIGIKSVKSLEDKLEKRIPLKKVLNSFDL
jgi:hypothetical protein